MSTKFFIPKSCRLWHNVEKYGAVPLRRTSTRCSTQNKPTKGTQYLKLIHSLSNHLHLKRPYSSSSATKKIPLILWKSKNVHIRIHNGQPTIHILAILFLEGPFKYHPSIYVQVFQVVAFLQIVLPQALYEFLFSPYVSNFATPLLPPHFTFHDFDFIKRSNWQQYWSISCCIYNRNYTVCGLFTGDF